VSRTFSRPALVPDQAHLASLRAIQRNLVYMIGIPVEAELSRDEYFGQCGPIEKIVVNSRASQAAGFQFVTVSACVTFCGAADACGCVFALEGFSLSGHAITESFGTSEYCPSVLSGQRCANHDCTHLHGEGDSFTTGEIQQNAVRFTELSRPGRPVGCAAFEDGPATQLPLRRAGGAKSDGAGAGDEEWERLARALRGGLGGQCRGR